MSDTAPPEIADDIRRWLDGMTKAEWAQFRRMKRLFDWSIEAELAGRDQQAKIFRDAAIEVAGQIVPDHLRDKILEYGRRQDGEADG